jgi:hypothetical protein
MKKTSAALDLSHLEDLVENEPSKPLRGPGGLKRSIQLKINAEDLGRADSLRHTVLTLVSDEEYLRAIARLKEFHASKHEYPRFDERALRYVTYACDLVNAIRAKRSFPGVETLAVMKQQELYDRASAHFNDLTATLRKIEQIAREVRAEDQRSTVWVVKAMSYSVFAVLAFAIFLELSDGILPTAQLVLNDTFDNFTNAIFNLFK